MSFESSPESSPESSAVSSESAESAESADSHGAARAPGARESSNPRAPESTPSVRRRLPYRVVASAGIALTLAAMGVADRVIVAKRNSASTALVDAGPVATTDDARSSTWFCVGATDNKPSIVVLANPTGQVRTGSIRILSAQGTLSTTPLTLNAGERTEVTLPVPPAPPGPSATTSDSAAGEKTEANAVVEAQKELGSESERGVAAVVEFDGGGVVADHRVGDSVAPCSAAAAPTWYLPDGATTRDATTSITLVNPFADDAIVDVFVATNTASARPSALQGVFVPAGTVRTVDLERFVRRRSYLSATVTTRTGRIVTEGFLRFDGSGTARGSTIVSASPSRGSAWYFPSGKASSVLRERYFLTNPGDTDLTVELAFLAADREEPFELDIPARSILEFDTSTEDRVPTGVDYSVVVASTNNRSFLVSRRLQAKSKFRSGLASTLGARVQSNRWTVADASSNAQIDDRIAVVNPTEDSTLVSVFQIGAPNSSEGDWIPLEGAQDIAMAGGSRFDVRIGDFVAVTGGTFAILSDGAPVIVDRTRVLVRERGNRPKRPSLAATTPEDATLESSAPEDNAAVGAAPSPGFSGENQIGGRGYAVSGATGAVVAKTTTTTGTTTTTTGLATTTTGSATTTTGKTTTTTGSATTSTDAVTTIAATSIVGDTTTTGLTDASSTTSVSTSSTSSTTSMVTLTTSSPTSTTSTADVPSTTTSTIAITTTPKPGAIPRVAVAVVARARVGTSTAMAIASAGA
jgi:Family of unknown function (DUF5719)